MKSYRCFNNTVPPVYVDNYGKMTPKQAKLFFQDFTENLSKRLDFFRERCAADLKLSTDALDYSPDSLKFAWRWFLKYAELQKTPKGKFEIMKQDAMIFAESHINREEFTDETNCRRFDISAYWGECFIRNHKNLFWSYVTSPKSNIILYQPSLSGMKREYHGKIYDISFAPIHMSGVQASVLLTNAPASENDLCKIHAIWEEYAKLGDIIK